MNKEESTGHVSRLQDKMSMHVSERSVWLLKKAQGGWVRGDQRRYSDSAQLVLATNSCLGRDCL